MAESRRTLRRRAALWLAHVLRHQVTDAQFNMSCFMAPPGYNGDDGYRDTRLNEAFGRLGDVPCGTVGCMAGHMAMRAPRHIQDSWIAYARTNDPDMWERWTREKMGRNGRLSQVAFQIARTAMRLSMHEAEELFLHIVSRADRQSAVRVLERFAKTDRISWDV